MGGREWVGSRSRLSHVRTGVQALPGSCSSLPVYFLQISFFWPWPGRPQSEAEQPGRRKFSGLSSSLGAAPGWQGGPPRLSGGRKPRGEGDMWTTRFGPWRLAALGLAVLLTGGVPAGAQERPRDADDEGIEVLARGPVHEAFAEPVAAKPVAGPVVAKEPPEPIDEVPPDEKPEGDNVRWIPGYWAWDDEADNFLWVSGFWRSVPPGRQWVPGHWAKVDEGYQWVPGFWAEEDREELEFLPPPPAPVESGPSVPAPGPDYSFVPGTWVYREARYLWRPGVWVRPRPGWVWTPARYCWTPSGYIFVDGFWDFPLRDRGVLFAPVAIDRRVWARPGWAFRPRYVCYENALVSALFVRPDHGHYYFGDYFDRRYERRGFVSWVDFRAGRAPDPLFSYYRWHHRDNRGWERDLKALYV